MHGEYHLQAIEEKRATSPVEGQMSLLTPNNLRRNYATLREKQHILGMRYHVQQLALENHA
jgi:hypothetical protein